MGRLIPVWTEFHGRILLMLLPAFVGTAVVVRTETFWVALASVALFALTSAGGLACHPFIAVGVGLAAAGALILIKQAAGLWEASAFLPSVLETLLFIATGLAAGAASGCLRRWTRSSEARWAPTAPGPVLGSLGLLPAGFGESRLQEEVERACLHHRPLALLRVLLEMRGRRRLRAVERHQLVRAVARLVESMMRVTDIPYAYDERHFMVVLPETDAAGASLLAGRLAEAVETSSFTLRPDNTAAPLRIRDYARVRVGLAALPEHGTTAADLLAASARTPAESPAVDGKSEPAPNHANAARRPGSSLPRQVSGSGRPGSATRTDG